MSRQEDDFSANLPLQLGQESETDHFSAEATQLEIERHGFTERPFIGRYKILESISIRRQSTVFKAFDPDLQRSVSLKLYHGQSKSDENIARVLSEARALVKIECPFVARCHNVETINGTPILVNEWVEGHSLDQYMDFSELSFSQVKKLFIKIVLGVQAIHEQGLLHRDIKPSNIIVDAKGEPTVIDLGLAQDSGELVQHLEGTVAFMPPEVVNREHSRIGIETDIFGLGGVLYFLLAGRPVYVAPTRDQLVGLARKCEYQPSHEVAGHSPNELDRICDKCLSPGVQDRFRTTAELLKRLRAKSAGLNVAMVGALVALAALAIAGTYNWSNKSNDNGSNAQMVVPLAEAIADVKVDQLPTEIELSISFQQERDGEFQDLDQNQKSTYQLGLDSDVRLVVSPKRHCWVAVFNYESNGNLSPSLVFPKPGVSHQQNSGDEIEIEFTPSATPDGETEHLLIVAFGTEWDPANVVEARVLSPSLIESVKKRFRGLEEKTDQLTMKLLPYQVR